MKSACILAILEFHNDALGESLSHIFRSVGRRVSTEHLSGLALRCWPIAFFQRRVRQLDCTIRRMRVPRCAVAGIQTNAKHTNDVIFELHFVVFGVRSDGIRKLLGSGLCRRCRNRAMRVTSTWKQRRTVAEASAGGRACSGQDQGRCPRRRQRWRWRTNWGSCGSGRPIGLARETERCR